MALSYVQYTGNGSNRNFSVTFPYIAREHVGVNVNGTPVTFTWLNASTIQTTTAPADGAIVDVRRTTPKDAPIIDFVDASTLLESDLDTLTNQLLFITQERDDASADLMQAGLDGAWDAVSRRIKNVATPTQANDAVNKTYADATVAAAEAAGAAQVALAAAQVSLATAEKTAAQTARTGAEAARDLAVTYRDTALTHANTAMGYRDTTLTYRNEAQTFRDQAQAASSGKADLAGAAFTGAVTAPSIGVSASFKLVQNTNSRYLEFDASDAMEYNAATNTFAILIGGSSQLALTASSFTVNGLTFAPRPSTAAGIGQFINVNNNSSSYTLPAGGTWAYSVFALISGTVAGNVSGVAAGGTTVSNNGAFNEHRGWAWRIS